MDIYSLNNSIFLQLVDNIRNRFAYADNKINTVKTKIFKIKKIADKFSTKKTLKLTECVDNLKFQMTLLNNELNYMATTRHILLTKLYNDVYTVAEDVSMIVGSLDNINEEYDSTNKTQDLIKKIAPIKKANSKNINVTSLLNLVKSLINNLYLIHCILRHFTNYIDKTDSKMIRENFHCRNLKTILSSQKNHLVLEYNNHCNCLEGILVYFDEITEKLVEQLKNQKLTDLLDRSPSSKKKVVKMASVSSISSSATASSVTASSATALTASSATALVAKKVCGVAPSNEENADEELVIVESKSQKRNRKRRQKKKKKKNTDNVNAENANSTIIIDAIEQFDTKNDLNH